MCITCLTISPQLTRRRFLHLGTAATLSALFTACSVNESPNSAGEFQNFSANQIDSLPDIAGQILAADAQSLTLRAPVGQRVWQLSKRTILKNEANQEQKSPNLTLGKTAVVWQDSDNLNQAAAVQLLSPISATSDDIPAGLVQPSPTGEKITFGPLELISRSGWGAAEPGWVVGGESGLYDPNTNPSGWLVYEEPLAARLHSIIVHHSALEFHDGPQAIQRLHRLTVKFADVGYHFFIDGFGQIYAGRPLNVRGAHAGGFNTGYVGICLLGNFEVAPILNAQRHSLRALVDYLRITYGITQIGGHRDFQPGITVCPGQNLHPQIPLLARELGMDYYPG